MSDLGAQSQPQGQPQAPVASPTLVTGYVPDPPDDRAYQPPQGAQQQAPPPQEVAGFQALPDSAAQPVIVVHGKSFRLATEIPGMLLMRLTATQQRMNRSPEGSDARAQAQAEVMAVMYDVITGVIHEDDREAYVYECEQPDPVTRKVLSIEELADNMRRGLEQITARPT